MKFNNIDIDNVTFNANEVLKVTFNGIVVFEKSSGEWILSDSKYIIGEDGKYYEYLYQGHVEETQPIIDLNDQWIEDTISTGKLDDYNYFMSNSNYHVAGGYSQFKVEWSGITHIDILYRSYGESGYDYLVVNGLDKDKFTSIPSDTTAGILTHTKGIPKTTFDTLSIDCDENTHWLWFCYRKDSSGDTYDDRAFVGVPKEIITIIETDHKKGNELSYEYIESDEYILVDESHIAYKYYKTYYTPNGDAHKTDEYILGDPIEATPFDPSQFCKFSVDSGIANLSYIVKGGLRMGDIVINDGTQFIETSTPWDGSSIQITTDHPIWVKNYGNGEEQTTSKYYKFKSTGGGRLTISGGNISNLKNFDGKYTYYKMFDNSTWGENMGLYNVSDGCMPNEPLKDYACYSMFRDNSYITKAPILPSTTLAPYCYGEMFYNSKLTTLPENMLPATTLADYCYSQMFGNCLKITSIPENLLPATTLADFCYSAMFYNCTVLTSLPSGLLPATTLANRCYNNMFGGCKGLTSIPENLLPSTTLATYCYTSMFNNCTGLTSLPSGLLPATTLVDSCYSSMFKGCSKLTTLPSGLLPATTLAQSCYSEMFRDCTGLTLLPSGLLPATTLTFGCYNAMFRDCSNLETVEELPNANFNANSYYYTFNNCPKLNYVKALFTTAPSDNFTGGWLSSVASEGTFVKNPEATWDVGISRGPNTVPTGWTIVNAEA